MPANAGTAAAFETIRQAHVLLQRASAELAAAGGVDEESDDAFDLQHALADVASTIREGFCSHGEAALEVERELAYE